MLAATVWVAIAATSAVRVWIIWGSFFWQDDYVHVWTAWNRPASDLILGNWNGHREPASFALQWVLTKAAVQTWWPAALLLSAIAVATSVMFWLMLRRWGGVTPATAAAAVLFAAWPATLVAQQWLSAGLETVPLLLMFWAGWLLARPGRMTAPAVVALALLAWCFHERAVYFLPVLFAIAYMFTGRRAWRDNRTSWLALATLTVVGLVLRSLDGLPGRDQGTGVAEVMWNAGPGSLLRSVLGWLPFGGFTPIPEAVGLWALPVIALWMVLLLVGLSTATRPTVIVLVAVGAVFVVETASYILLRGGAAGGPGASDPRFTLVSGVVLLAGLASLPIPWKPVAAVAVGIAIIGCWSMLERPATPGRQWLAAARAAGAGQSLAATPSPPEMLGHFFFTTTPPVYELGTTRTLLQVGSHPPDFPSVAQRPVQIDVRGSAQPLEFTVLSSDPSLQCGSVRPPPLDAGVRVVRIRMTAAGQVQGVPVGAGDVYYFPPPGPLAPVRVDGCVTGTEVGIPGR